MIKLSLLRFQICTVVLITSQLFVPILTVKKTSNIREIMFENQRTRMRQNYVMQRAINNDNFDNGEVGVTYVSEPLDPINNSEELPLLLDSANMRRNKIIWLDNSVETRTRKRGNIINELPCSCEEKERKLEDIGDDYFPSIIENTVCNEKLCPAPYGCQKITRNITVLKRKKFTDEVSLELPEELQKRWTAVKITVTVGCMCKRDQTYYY